METIPLLAALDAAGVERPPGACFEAPTPHGALRLRCREPAAHALAAAAALGRCADLLDALDAWCGAALDWRWTPAPAPPAAHAPAVRCPGGELLAPWAWWRARPTPPGPLRGLLHWPALPAVAELARLDLSAGELAALEPGGAVLVPAGARARLRAGDEPGGGDDCELRLTLPPTLPGEVLAGWIEPPFALSPDDGAAALWHGGRCLASGRLVAWGDARALLVEAV